MATESDLGVDTWRELDESEEADGAKQKLLQFNNHQAKQKIIASKKSQKQLSDKNEAAFRPQEGLTDSKQTRRLLD